jgi:hypothetical protein
LKNDEDLSQIDAAPHTKGTLLRKQSTNIQLFPTSFPIGRMEFHVQSVMARRGSDVLARTRHLGVFGVFLSAIEGNAVEVTHESTEDLWALCDEFQFWNRQ